MSVSIGGEIIIGVGDIHLTYVLRTERKKPLKKLLLSSKKDRSLTLFLSKDALLPKPFGAKPGVSTWNPIAIMKTDYHEVEHMFAMGPSLISNSILER